MHKLIDDYLITTPKLLDFEKGLKKKVNIDSSSLSMILLNKKKVVVSKENIDILSEHMMNFGNEILANVKHLEDSYKGDFDWDMMKLYNISVTFDGFMRMTGDLKDEVYTLLDAMENKHSVYVISKSKELDKYIQNFNKEIAKSFKNIRFDVHITTKDVPYIR